MIEVEVRETPKRSPIPTPGLLRRGLGAGGAVNGNETVSSSTVGGMEDAAAGATDGWIPDSTSLSPDALFRAYLKREREGGRNVSEKVGAAVRFGRSGGPAVSR